MKGLVGVTFFHQSDVINESGGQVENMHHFQSDVRRQHHMCISCKSRGVACPCCPVPLPLDGSLLLPLGRPGSYYWFLGIHSDCVKGLLCVTFVHQSAVINESGGQVENMHLCKSDFDKDKFQITF